MRPHLSRLGPNSLAGLGFLVAPGGGGGATPTPTELLTPGVLNPLITFARAQASGAKSTALAVDGTTWVEYAADTPRFNSTAVRMLSDGQRTNQNTNPRGEGIVAGTPGTRPTGWPALPTGVTSEMVGTTTIDGVPGILVRFVGTPSVTTGQAWTIGGAADTVVAGTTVANSVLVALTAGTLTNINTFDLRAGSSEGGVTLFTPNAALTRIFNTRVLTGTSSGTLIRWNYVNTSTPVDFTLFIGWPTREHATFSTTPILPVVGTPGASTRGADLLTTTLTNLGIGAGGDCTVYWSGTASVVNHSADQFFIALDDGTANNRFFVRLPSAAAGMVVGRTLAGAASASASSATISANALFAMGMTISAGRAAVFVSGGTLRSVTGGPTSGLTTLRLGSDAAGASNLFGRPTRISYFPYAVSDAELQSAVAVFPTS